MPTDNIRFVLCGRCDREGRILTSNGGPYDTDHGICPDCDGHGDVEVEGVPITLDDLDEMAGEAE